VLFINFFQKVVSGIFNFLVANLFKKLLNSAFFHGNFLIFFALDPDPDSQYGSGYAKSLNPDPQPCFRIFLTLSFSAGIK
jgi:hypothetical protein